MKTQLIEYLGAANERRETRNQRKWRRIRRLGRLRFVLLFITGFWLLMVTCFFFAAWMILPSLDALDRLPSDFYRQLLFVAPVTTGYLYFGAAYTWRVNDLKYPK